LPAVPAELDVLARHFPPGNGNLQLTGPQATRAAVLAAIADHSWVHLACHARQEHADPARSGFALWDGTLTITDLAAQAAQDRELAFLSACQTAAGSNRLLDEAIHLAAAMQFLGYQHVIATLWTIADSPAPDIADAFYTALTRDGTPDRARAAQALHHATRTLRQADPTSPLLWAPYIHLGS
jgi:CHAT domain-containing protein